MRRRIIVLIALAAGLARGSSVNRFVLGEHGKRLTVKTQVQIDRLAEPIRFDFTYRRISD